MRSSRDGALALMPCRTHFLASVAYGEKAVEAARVSDLAGSTLELISAAPRIAEGRTVRFAVRTKKDREQVELLLRIEMSIGPGGAGAARGYRDLLQNVRSAATAASRSAAGASGR